MITLSVTRASTGSELPQTPETSTAREAPGCGRAVVAVTPLCGSAQSQDDGAMERELLSVAELQLLILHVRILTPNSEFFCAAEVK